MRYYTDTLICLLIIVAILTSGAIQRMMRSVSCQLLSRTNKVEAGLRGAVIQILEVNEI